MQDPKDTPAPTRAETKEERVERKVLSLHINLTDACLLINAHPNIFNIFFKQTEREERHTEQLKSVLETCELTNLTIILTL